MKKGFTLIELLGVIAILAIIVLVAVPAFIESNRDATLTEEEDFNETIEVATKDYINACPSLEKCLSKHPDGFDSLFTTNQTIAISVSDLKEAGFLKKDLKTPDNQDVTGTISVTSKDGKLTVKYGG